MATTCSGAVLAVAPCGVEFNAYRPRREQLAIFLLDATSNNTVEELTTYLTDATIAAKLAAIACLGVGTVKSRQASWVAALIAQDTLSQLKCLSDLQLEALILSLMCDTFNVIHPD